MPVVLPIKQAVPRGAGARYVVLIIVVIGCLIASTAFTVFSSGSSPLLSSASASRWHWPFAKSAFHEKPSPPPGRLRDGSEANTATSVSKPGAAMNEVVSQLMTQEEFEELQQLVDFTRTTRETEHGNIQNYNSSGLPTCAKKRRLLFALTTGHTGTMWLLRVLRCSLCAGRVEHEPKPALVHFPDVLRMGREASYEKRRDEKLPVLVSLIENGTYAPGKLYAETSHMFIKAWYDVFTTWLEENDPNGEKYDVDIVVLRRNISSVVRSFLTDKMFWDPAFNIQQSTGGEYTLNHRRMAILPSLLPHGSEDSVDEVLGYLADMELQYARFRRRFPQFRYWDVRAEELYTPLGARRFLNTIGLAPLSEFCMFQLTYTRPVNQHVSWKAPELLEVPPEYFRARAMLFAMRYRSLGIPFPEMPQLRETFACNTTATPTPWCEGPLPDYSMDYIRQLIDKYPEIPHNHPPVRAAVPLFNIPLIDGN